MSSLGGQCVTALGAVVFDVDVGNKCESIYPPGALTPEEESDVAFHSFPDSISMELRTKSSVRDCSFFFRMRRRPADQCGAAPRFLYGFVFCRQRQDERLRRGGEQKSVVVLSELPLSSLLTPLSRFLGPLVLAYGVDALQQVYEEVCSSWPPPAWGSHMTLPLAEVGTISAAIPELSTLPALWSVAGGPAHRQQQQQPQQQGGIAVGVAATESHGQLAREPQQSQKGGQLASVCMPEEGQEDLGWPEALLLAEMDDATGLPLCLLPQAYGQQELVEGPYTEMDVYTPLKHVLQQLWALWEVLVLGEPLLVAAPTPAACSGAVAALVSLLTPLPYAADYRPYLTIHDPCFARLAGGTLPSLENDLPCLLGVTNFYFIKALPAWPNVLSTGYAAQLAQQAQQQQQQGSSNGLPAEDSSSHGGSSDAANGGGFWRSESSQSIGSSSGGSRLGQALRRRSHGPQSLLSEAHDALWMAYKPLIRPDKEVLGRLAAPRPTDPYDKASRAALLNTMVLRRHFQELTQAVLFPLLPYISPAPPPPMPRSASDLQSPPPLPPIDKDAILQNLGSKSGTVPDILLRRFGSHKTLVQARAWHEAWWEAGGPLTQAGSGHMGEVVTVEAFFQLEQQLLFTEGLPQPQDAAAELREQLQTLFVSMPRDLQRSLLLSPQRAAWLKPSLDKDR
ncbi:hypothetical protein N2152v2_007755 [Parachlorella kessleri]